MSGPSPAEHAWFMEGVRSAALVLAKHGVDARPYIALLGTVTEREIAERLSRAPGSPPSPQHPVTPAGEEGVAAPHALQDGTLLGGGPGTQAGSGGRSPAPPAAAWSSTAPSLSTIPAYVTPVATPVLLRLLAESLVEAMEAIATFHGPGWALYRDESPEMERWRVHLRVAGVTVPEPLRVQHEKTP